MVQDLHQFIATFASPISQSAPHIYISTVPFAPHGSTVSRLYGSLYPSTLRIKEGGLSEMPVLQRILKGHTGGVNSVAFSPDGAHIVSGSSDKTIRIWDAATGKVVAGPFEGRY
jgi:WD40 repeat protein